MVSIRIRWKSLGGLIEMFGAPDISGGLRWRVSDCDRPPRSLKMTETVMFHGCLPHVERNEILHDVSSNGVYKSLTHRGSES